MAIVLKVPVNAEFLLTIENSKNITGAIKECKKHVRCLWIDKNRSITTAFELTNSKEDLFPVDIYRVVPSSELNTTPFHSLSNN
jgi:hypothetical protein